jgi:hypothetical protein
MKAEHGHPQSRFPECRQADTDPAAPLSKPARKPGRTFSARYPAVETDEVERVLADVDADCCNGLKAIDSAWHGMLLIL